MVEVFTTNLEESTEAAALASLVLQHYPYSKVSFDLDDCDKVMRVEGYFDTGGIQNLFSENGYECSVME